MYLAKTKCAGRLGRQANEFEVLNVKNPIKRGRLCRNLKKKLIVIFVIYKNEYKTISYSSKLSQVVKNE